MDRRALARWRCLPTHAPTQTRPWTRWWWLGGAVDEAGITQHLQAFRDAGFGGVEVSPIYAADDEAPERTVAFLSPRWRQLFAHTVAEARRLNLGVDLICGTGWPFGGPRVSPEDAAQKVVFDGDAFRFAPTGQKVKRAGPGGDGWVLDHFNRDALLRYLAAFDAALRPRCFFNDSWEVYGADGSPAVLARFFADHGYRLEDHTDAWRGAGDPDTAARVRCDYRTTVENLIRDDFLGVWREWAKARGAATRNQAHGSPGNLLDLYAAADIPETEVFGAAVVGLAGHRPVRPVKVADRRSALEELLACRLAASAARIAGRPLASAESFTWLGEHGCVPLEHARAEANLLFTAGINHLFFHGTAYSPEGLPWPGRRFYAATHVAPAEPLWRDLPALNAHLARCQSLLQQGAGDGDALVYLPVWDQRMRDIDKAPLLHFYTVHNTAQWLRDGMPTLAALQARLYERGWAFDLVSDRLLETSVRAERGALVTAGGARYRSLIVPAARVMPPETLERIAALAEAGVPVLFVDRLPEDVPGLPNVEARRQRLAAAARRLSRCVGGDVEEFLARAGARRLTLADAGVRSTRRTIGGDTLWFLFHAGDAPVEGEVPGSGTPLLLDPATGRAGVLPRPVVRLRPGEARFLRFCAAGSDAPPWDEPTTGAPIALAGPWEVSLLAGGPPAPPRTLSALTDASGWGDGWGAVAGTILYRTTFDAPSPRGRLSLGRVCHSARVRVNGRDAGVVIGTPWEVDLAGLKRRGNVLEVEVTTLAANRLADLDRRKVPWRRFFVVDFDYKPFDASHWEPVPAGLLGLVTLSPPG